MHVFVVFNFVSYILFDLVKTCSFLSLVFIMNISLQLLRQAEIYACMCGI